MKRFFIISSLLLLIFIQTTAQTPDWLQTARVFLIDAYQPPFVPELEYDAEAIAETMVDMNANVLRIGTMGKFATIQGVRFSTHPDQQGRDLLAETIAACKKRNIRVVAYFSTGHKVAWSMVPGKYPEYSHIASPGGGPEKLQMMIGEDHGTVCWMTPYKDAYMDMIEHVIRDYDVDAMYFDAWRPQYFWTGMRTCYCDGCTKGFKKATGHDIPYHSNRADYTDEELTIVKKYYSWYFEEYIKIVRETRKLIKSYKDVPLISNVGNAVSMANSDPRILEAMDAFLYERGESILHRAEGVSLATGVGLDIWPYVGVYNTWQRVAYDGYNFQQQILTNMMFGGGSIIAQPYPYVDHTENRHYVRNAFSIIADHEQDISGLENYPYVAVVYSHKDPEGHQKSNWWATADARNASLGAFAACIHNHVQVSSLHEFLLDEPEKLKNYKVLYLADETHLTEQRIQNIKEFVRDGGSLVVGYSTSLYNDKGQRQNRFGLEELIRVKPIIPDEKLEKFNIKYSSKIGGPSDLYLMSNAKGSTILGNHWDNRLVPLWFYEQVEVLDGAEVIMNVVTGDGKRPMLPGVVLSKYGKGKVIYCTSTIESLYLEEGIYILGELIRDLIKVASPEKRPYTIDAPASLMTNLAVKDNTWVIHLTNWTGNKFERAQTNEYYLAPVEDVKIEINIPEGKSVKSITTFVESSFKKNMDDEKVKIIIPRIGAYQGIKIEFD
ncbi:family 10 glycosylhydrolase [Bacteroidota bacterium]